MTKNGHFPRSCDVLKVLDQLCPHFKYPLPLNFQPKPITPELSTFFVFLKNLDFLAFKPLPPNVFSFFFFLPSYKTRFCMMATSLVSKIAAEPAEGSGGDLSEVYKLARYRRNNHSSSASSEAGQFLVSVVKFRVAAPPAWPLPVHNHWNDDCELIRQALGNGLEREVNSVLLANGVDVVEQYDLYATALIFRAVEGDDTRGQPTVLVVATWDDTSPVVWGRAVKQAKRFIDAKALAHGHHLDIAVEIIAEELTRELYVSHISECELTSGLARDWDCIKGNVGRILKTNEATEGKVSTIPLFRLGSSVKLDANPLTVYVSVDYESSEGNWPPIIDQIQHYLNGYPYKFQLHIEHDSLQTYPALDLLLKPMTAEEQGRRQRLKLSLDSTY